MNNYNYQGFIDIIIPVFNDAEGLLKSLCSLNIFYPFHVIVIDDCSTTDNYDNIIQFFNQFLNIEIHKTNKNGGPAVAKNCGLTYSKNKYVMFLDSGDTLISANIIPSLEKILEENPSAKMLAGAYYKEENSTCLELIPSQHNCWQGKVYERAFLLQYNLHFNEESSFCNDDIGMNMLARLLLKPEQIIEYNEPVLIWHNTNPNSITRKNNHQYYYKENNSGVSLAAIYAVEQARKYFINPLKINEFCCTVICGLYFFHLGTINKRPEFIEESLQGAKIFYDKIYQHLDIEDQMITDIYNISVERRYSKEDEDVKLKIPKLTFWDFLD